MIRTQNDQENWGAPPSVRPWWLSYDKCYFVDDDDKPCIIPIKSLSAEKFKELKKTGAIPKEYKIEDWIS